MSFTLEARLTWECMSVSSCKVQMLSSEAVIGRRSLLSEAALVAGVAGLPLPASAKAGAKSAGAWAKHEGEFTEEELDGFTETKSGLLYKDIEVGTGVIPQTGQKIKAHYSGYLLESGKKFDSSYDRGKPLPFAVGTGQVIKGWDEALLSMKVGSKRMLVIPAKLAYGKKAVGTLSLPSCPAAQPTPPLSPFLSCPPCTH